MNRADTAEQDLELVDLSHASDGERPIEGPSAMDTDLERLLIAIHEPAHL